MFPDPMHERVCPAFSVSKRRWPFKNNPETTHPSLSRPNFITRRLHGANIHRNILEYTQKGGKREKG